MATGWQPIDTAPRDGHGHHAERDIDLWHKRQGRLADCFWSPYFRAWMSRSGGNAYNMGGDECFTHWMPKPPPPLTAPE
jgi:hypothetical protein